MSSKKHSLIERLIESKHYINNLSCENLVFDGNRWHVVDSSEIKEISHSKINQKYERNLLEIWSRGLRSDDKKDSLKSFLENNLEIPTAIQFRNTKHSHYKLHITNEHIFHFI